MKWLLPVLTQKRSAAMSAIAPLLAEKRTSRVQPAFDLIGLTNDPPLMYQHPWTRFLGPPVSLPTMYLIGWVVSAIRCRRKVKMVEALAHKLVEAKKNDA
jgi:hypothetical protein